MSGLRHIDSIACRAFSTAPMSRADFAWEFLRRNLRYRAIACASLATRDLGVFEEDAVARPWGLQFIIDPRLPSHLANVFWRPEMAPGLVVRLQRAQAGEGELLDIQGAVARQRCGPDGLHLRFPSGLQAHVPAGDLNHALAVVLPISGPFSARLRAAQGLQRAMKGQVASLGADLTRQQDIRLRRMLRAVDGHLRQRTYREIATDLFGLHALEAEPWRTSSLKDVVVRLVRTGRALVAGGYLRLLSR